MDEIYNGIYCDDCGMPYGSPSWIECVVPDDIWSQISPSVDEGGILCIQCIVNKLDALDLRSTCKLTAGRLRSNDFEQERTIKDMKFAIDELICRGFQHEQGFICGWRKEDSAGVRMKIKNIDKFREGYSLGSHITGERHDHTKI